jgi:hypothetical protein
VTPDLEELCKALESGRVRETQAAAAISKLNAENVQLRILIDQWRDLAKLAISPIEETNDS